jgi:translation initiation factor 2B subunit (eIF-2B alpha/beta/delta family)
VWQRGILALCSYKFVNVFPLNQDDLSFGGDRVSFEDEDDINEIQPKTDYTPPEFVSMFFTNEGVLTPSGVSELFLRSSK